MRIGIVCYASVGGSGVVATELAYALADRGHDVHLISSDRPFRWRDDLNRLRFEPVVVPPYPLFHEPQYLLALSNTIARVSDEHHLDIVHAHYAVPHATAAYLASQMLASAGDEVPRVVTTLHGTDITLVGSDASYKRVVAFSIERSDGVSAVSASLRRDTVASLGVQRDIQVIPNFLDCATYRRLVDPDLRARLCAGECDAVVLHVSNFRPVKRVDAALEVFKRIRRRVRARFVLIGDGPTRGNLEEAVMREGLAEDVLFAGEQRDLVPWLSAADLFLLPSAQESFGLAALEAMACEVPVIASAVGGLPEVVDDGVTGFLRPPDAVDAMAECAIALLTDRARHDAFARAAADVVRSRFCTDRIVPLYERLYADVLSTPRATTESRGSERPL